MQKTVLVLIHRSAREYLKSIARAHLLTPIHCTVAVFHWPLDHTLLHCIHSLHSRARRGVAWRWSAAEASQQQTTTNTPGRDAAWDATRGTAWDGARRELN